MIYPYNFSMCANGRYIEYKTVIWKQSRDHRTGDNKQTNNGDDSLSHGFHSFSRQRKACSYSISNSMAMV